MGPHLDILALEPFFGGARRAMLETLIRHSRHHWTLLTLPPRRVERRLAAAAQWFAEQLSRHWVGRVDVLFASEAMNLGTLFNLVPQLTKQPAVVYFHDNQLPEPTAKNDGPLDVVNLSTAMAATEVWFNSAYHQRLFLHKAAALIARHEELSAGNPIPEITSKAQVMPPPVDLKIAREAMSRGVKRDMHTLFADTREADVRLLNSAMNILARRNVKFKMVTVGPVEGLDPELPRRTISERDEPAQIAALAEVGVHVSTRHRAVADHHAIRALSVGCWPIYPRAGVYPELLPKVLHPFCTYDRHSETLANRLHDIFTIEQPKGYEGELRAILKPYDAAEACKNIDDRLEQLAVINSLAQEG